MRTVVSLIMSLSIGSLLIAGCSKWTDPKDLVVQNVNTDSASLGPAYTRYLVNLRDYKASAHIQTIGFFDGNTWLTDGTRQKTFLSSLPDSMDMVGILNQDTALTSAQMADMRSVRNTKGTKVIFYLDLKRMNDSLENQRSGWGSDDTTAAINKYLDSVISVYTKYNYNGLYLVYEGLDCFDCDGIFSRPNANNVMTVVKKLSAIAGPRSGTGSKLLLQGSDAQYLDPAVGGYVDYFVFDALGSNLYTLDALLHLFGSIEGFTPSKLIVSTSLNLNLWVTGGEPIDVGDGSTLPATQAFANWIGTGGLKGGISIQYVEEDYNNNPPYKFTRQCIQQLNPAVR